MSNADPIQVLNPDSAVSPQSNPSTFYNDNDPFCADRLCNLVAAGHLSSGTIDRRDIRTLQSFDLAELDNAHFFAGVGGWPFALQLAGWPRDWAVWTASCPCQPLSCAGQRKGHADKRHLWPAFHALVDLCRPPTIFGEQVASALGREWLAGIRADLEGMGYAVGSADLCAASAGAPQIRQRLYWVALARGRDGQQICAQTKAGQSDFDGRGQADRLASTRGHRWETRTQDQRRQARDFSSRDFEGVGLASKSRLQERQDERSNSKQEREATERAGSECSQRVDFANGARLQPGKQTTSTVGHGNPALSTSFWSDCEIIQCADGLRRIEPGSFPMAHGVPSRMGRLRAYGNALCVPLAVEFVKAVLDVIREQHSPKIAPSG